MSNTTWAFILFVLIFYSIISVVLVSMGISSNITGINNISIPTLPENPNITDYMLIIFNYTGFFFSMIGYTISALPFWFNLIIFFPLGMTILWVIISLIRGVS